jgi:ADP-ribose pyrophosphatase
MPLPPFPGVRLEEVEDLTPAGVDGFLTLRRHRMCAAYADGSTSEPFVYDTIDRRALDAVVVVAHYQGEDGTCMVFLRSAIRPPLLLRAPEQRPIPEKDSLGHLWEVVAGLVEPHECSPDGLVLCAARELEEELGFTVSTDEVQPLGTSMFPCPGVIGERHHFFHVEVKPGERRPPTEDGSVLERGASIMAIPLPEAMDLVRRGDIEDSKTELILRRLRELP